MKRRAYLVGWPVSHSLSPLMHEAAFEALGLTGWTYNCLAVKPINLRRTLSELLGDQATVGVNVTIPHKTTVLDLVPAAAPLGPNIGAANTLARDAAGCFCAHNTDVAGFAACLEPLGERPINRALLLGAGGSARACAAALLADDVTELGIISRRREQSQRLLTDLSLPTPNDDNGVQRARVWQWANLEEALDWLAVAPGPSADHGRPLVVNTTPLGMWPKAGASPLSAGQLAVLPRDCLVVDLVYRPRPTRLVRSALTAGLTALDGQEMLVQQGFASLALWLNRNPGPAALTAMRQAVQQALEEDARRCSD